VLYLLYSEPTNTGPSGIRMVIFRTLFVSGFRMALAAILFFPFENRTKKSGFRMVWTVLYKNINIHIYKMVQPDHSKTGHDVRFSSAIRISDHSTTGHKSNSKTYHG
jgi:hypothetical protein